MRLNIFSKLTNGSDMSTILIVPNDGLENIKSLQILADELKQRGSKVLFALETADKGLTTCSNPCGLSDQAKSTTEEEIADYNVFTLPAIEVFEKFTLKSMWKKFSQNLNRDYEYQRLIEKIKPNLIIVESTLCLPALTNSGIPWVWINFSSPIRCIPDDRLPPAWAGFSKKTDAEEWSKFIEQKNFLLTELRRQLNEWCVSRGAPQLPDNCLHPSSPFLNVYVYPTDLDWSFGENYPPTNWVNISCISKQESEANTSDLTEKLELPEEFLERPGKLVYFAMDSLGSSDVNLMKRVTALLSQSPNKFIVAKGKYHDQYELADNMWGAQHIPHTEAIKAADLVLTCGDTSTVTEALFYGKPLVVMPLHDDQFDNAIRLKDCTFAVVLEPYKCQLSTTYASIVALLDDPSVQRRLDSVSHKMQDCDQLKNLIGQIEGLVRS